MTPAFPGWDVIVGLVVCTMSVALELVTELTALLTTTRYVPALLACTERFVKAVWPAFRAAGKRPKAAPYTLPIFSSTPYWMAKPREERLRAFIQLKEWLLDDLVRAGAPPTAS